MQREHDRKEREHERGGGRCREQSRGERGRETGGTEKGESDYRSEISAK